MKINEYFRDWIKVIDKNKLLQIIQILNNLYQSKCIMPGYHNIFKAFTLLDLKDTKVIFLGQDPYPQLEVATGVLFGNNVNNVNNNNNENILSPSLEVIKEAAINYELYHNPYKFDITLESWAKQGILLLNSALTVEVNKVGSHAMLWRPFMSGLLKSISEINPGIIYVLFGTQAQTFEPYINKNNIILKVKHPAYYARNKEKMPPEIFITINKLVKKYYGEQIKWFTQIY